MNVSTVSTIPQPHLLRFEQGFSLAELAAGLHLSDEPHEVDPESRARLEKLLEAAGLDNIEPEILSRLTSSVSCALDEAAAALTRMRFEKHLEKHHPSSSSNQTKGMETKQRTSSSPSSNSGTTKPASSSPASCLHPLEGRPPIVEDLDSDACCSLIDACNEGDLEAVRRLLEEGRNVNEVTEEGESLLSLACSSGYLELAQLLLATTRANVEDRGLRDMTPLMEAASAGHFDVVRLLLDHVSHLILGVSCHYIVDEFFPFLLLYSLANDVSHPFFVYSFD